MQFQVPQFIEVEDKIFGPFTFKQFVYMAGAAGISYMLWRTLPIFLAVPFIALFAGGGAALAFFKYNGQPFILALEHGFYYIIHTKLYLWSSDSSAPKAAKATVAESPAIAPNLYVPRLSDSKLHELAWSLDIKERIAAGVGDDRDRMSVPQDNIVAPIRTARDALVR